MAPTKKPPTFKCLKRTKILENARNSVKMHKGYVHNACAKVKYISGTKTRIKKCIAKTSKGKRCQRLSVIGTEYCWQHAPTYSRGGLWGSPLRTPYGSEGSTRYSSRSSVSGRFPLGSSVSSRSSAASPSRSFVSSWVSNPAFSHTPQRSLPEERSLIEF